MRLDAGAMQRGSGTGAQVRGRPPTCRCSAHSCSLEPAAPITGRLAGRAERCECTIGPPPASCACRPARRRPPRQLRRKPRLMPPCWLLHVGCCQASDPIAVCWVRSRSHNLQPDQATDRHACPLCPARRRAADAGAGHCCIFFCSGHAGAVKDIALGCCMPPEAHKPRASAVLPVDRSADVSLAPRRAGRGRMKRQGDLWLSSRSPGGARGPSKGEPGPAGCPGGAPATPLGRCRGAWVACQTNVPSNRLWQSRDMRTARLAAPPNHRRRPGSGGRRQRRRSATPPPVGPPPCLP